MKFFGRKKSGKKEKQSSTSSRRKTPHPKAIVHGLLPELDSHHESRRLSAQNDLINSQVDITPALIDVFRNKIGSFTYRQRSQVAAIVVARGDADFVSTMKEVYKETEFELTDLMQPALVAERRRRLQNYADMNEFGPELHPGPPDLGEECRAFGIVVATLLSQQGHGVANAGNVDSVDAVMCDDCIPISGIDYLVPCGCGVEMSLNFSKIDPANGTLLDHEGCSPPAVFLPPSIVCSNCSNVKSGWLEMVGNKDSSS